MNESAWNRLLQKIRESNVVPILGSRLLVGADGQTSLQEKIARRLLEDCGKSADAPLTPFRELNEAVFLVGNNIQGQELYDRVNDAICSVIHPRPPAPQPAIPAPIRQLAQIADFRLYVTLTPDDFLVQSLKKRCAVNEIVHAPNLATSDGKDLPSDWKSRAGEVQVLFLFGRACTLPNFAIHDEDVLEYAHNVIARGSQVPKAFLGELQQRNLLLIGCNFPDWLTRFFLRAFAQTPLSKKDMRAWLIEPLQPEESLTVFLRSYSKETEVLSQDSPVEFVAELHRRWMELAGGGAEVGPSEADQHPPRAMFFISYSRKSDVSKAESIYKALLNLKVSEAEVWFDRQAIDPGEDYQRKILDGIQGCRYFLPVISRATNQREEGYVFREWDEACKRLPEMNREFVLPVIVDAEYRPDIYGAKQVWEWKRRNIDFGHAPDGTPDPQLERKLKKLVREARRGGGQA